jgi:hypothetical protein
MKASYQYTIPGRQKPKKPKRKAVARSLTAESIAQRYMELQRLRQRISEAESWRVAR